MIEAEGKPEIPQSSALTEATVDSLSVAIDRFSQDPENNQGDLARIVVELRADRVRKASLIVEGRPLKAVKGQKPSTATTLSAEDMGFDL